MKTPLTYYGGKQQLSGKIIELIPSHKVYCEPFVGGGAIFFRKDTSDIEIINDINGELVNFYEVLQRDFSSLYQEVLISLHSRELHTEARVVYEHPKMFGRIKRAWAVWMLANESFGAMFDGGWGYDKSGQTTKKISSKREEFTEELAIRLQNVQIEYTDALKIIRSRDTEETFFYCDPPYPDTDQGHYDGYSEDDFLQLMKTLEGIQGKFLLSSFRNKNLNEYTERNGWHQIEIRMAKPMSAHTKRSTAKIEVLTANYPIS
jgi:Site-specific DNA methylase